MDKPLCVVCGWRPVRASNRCATCYPYWIANKKTKDRTETLDIRGNVRAAEREFEVAAWGGPMPAPPPTEGERLRRRIAEATRERQERRRR